MAWNTISDYGFIKGNNYRISLCGMNLRTYYLEESSFNLRDSSIPLTGRLFSSSRPIWVSTDAWSQYICSYIILFPSNFITITTGISTYFPVGWIPGRMGLSSLSCVKLRINSSTTWSFPTVRDRRCWSCIHLHSPPHQSIQVHGVHRAP